MRKNNICICIFETLTLCKTVVSCQYELYDCKIECKVSNLNKTLNSNISLFSLKKESLITANI